MSNKQKGYDAKDFKHVTPQLIEVARRVVADRDGRRFSTSNIYKAHNGIFNLKEPAQTCDTCLTLRANAVAKWLAWYDAPAAPQTQPNVPALPTPGTAVVNATEVTAVPMAPAVPAEGGAEPEVVVNESEAAQPVTVAADGYVPLAEGAVRVILQKVAKDDYTKTDGDALYADKLGDKFTSALTGKALQAGTYATEDPTQVLGVQPGGKGTYKPVQ